MIIFNPRMLSQQRNISTTNILFLRNVAIRSLKKYLSFKKKKEEEEEEEEEEEANNACLKQSLLTDYRIDTVLFL